MVGINFNQKQFDRMSEVLGNLSLLLIGSLVIPSLTSPVNLGFETKLLALFTIMACISGSLVLIEGGEDNG